jgi:hypothetical protein
MSKPTIATNTSIIAAIGKPKDPSVPSPEQQPNESLSSSLDGIQPIYLPALNPALSGPIEAIANATAAIVDAARQTTPDLSKESVNILKSFINKSSKGFAGVLPMVCKGIGCPFLHSCPLYEAKAKLPVGSKCPVEESITYMWVNKHLRALGIDNVDAAENSFDMDMLYELAGQELIRWRCGSYMANTPSLVENKMIGESFSGTPIFADVLNPVLEAMERAGKNVAKIRDALLATRKAQINAGQVAVDATQKAAELRKKAAEINKARRTLNLGRMRDADFTILDNRSEDSTKLEN